MAEPQEFVYGINPIHELVAAYPEEVQEILIARHRKDPRIRRLLEAAESRGIPVHGRPNEALTRLAGNVHHQGLVAVVSGFRYTPLDTLVTRLEQVRTPLVLLLDGIQDPGNLGALIRSAHVLGADAVIIPRDRAARVTPAARKASAGATEHLPVVRVTNVARTMVHLFEEVGIWWVGLDAEAGGLLHETDLDAPLGLVIGGEGKGMRQLTRKRCHFLCKIPSAGTTGVGSLNAAAAGAIALYEVQRQRSAARGAASPALDADSTGGSGGSEGP